MGFAEDYKSFPVTRIAEPRTIRLVATANLRDSVLKALLEHEAAMPELIEIEGATSGRLNVQVKGADRINPRELVAGVPHAHFINAAFSYWRPKELNRFNGPDRGAWYAAFERETCVAEVTFHMTRELERVDNFNAVVEYIEMFASFAGEYIDLRGLNPLPICLHPDPAIGYPPGNIVSERTLAEGQNGIVYPSVRRTEGTCIVALRPQAVQSVAQGSIMRLSWKGKPLPEFEIVKE